MTDADAKKRIEGTIEGLVAARGVPWPTEEMRAQYERGSAADIAALRHSLRAIEDREALVSWASGQLFSRPGVVVRAVDAARRHMRGEE